MSAETQPLLEFIEALKSQGASDEFVVAFLRQNGWSEKRVYHAFSAWYEARTGKAVPNGGGRIEAAKDAFLYLLAFITLGIWTVQLGALFFAVIDRTFPNPALDLPNTTWMTISMANELASIIVAFPLFLLVTASIVRAVQRQPERLESSARKWLTYIALVITASVMIGDVVTFLAYFLRGDLDTRFVLKVITVLVIAGLVFGYYLDSLRRERVSSNRNFLFAGAAAAIVAFGLISGFFGFGSPASQRAASQDARRLYDLSVLAQGMRSRWATRGSNPFVPPETIEDLQKTAHFGSPVSILDPVTRQPYEYTPLPGTAYRLCATFANPSPPDAVGVWRHGAGHVCFDLDASETTPFVPRAF